MAAVTQLGNAQFDRARAGLPVAVAGVDGAMWGAGLSLDMWKFAKAERVLNLEGSTCDIAMRDGGASRGLKAGSRMESNRRNMRGPIGSAGLVSSGGWQRGKARDAIRAEIGSRT